MLLSQLVVLVVLLFFLVIVIANYKSRRIRKTSLLFWILICLGLLVTAFFPDIIVESAKILGIGRSQDVVIYVSILVLFYLVFLTYVKLESSDRKIKRIITEISLKDLKKKKK